MTGEDGAAPEFLRTRVFGNNDRHVATDCFQHAVRHAVLVTRMNIHIGILQVRQWISGGQRDA